MQRSTGGMGLSSSLLELKTLQRELEWVARRLPMAEDRGTREVLFGQLELIRSHIDVLIDEKPDPAPAGEAAPLHHARDEVGQIIDDFSRLVRASFIAFPDAQQRRHRQPPVTRSR